MKSLTRIIALFGLLVGCANPIVQLVDPRDENVNGVRVRRVIPYEIFIYAVDGSRTLVLKEWKVENLPDPNKVYAINYNGALVTSSKFTVTLHENGGLNTVRVETTRTLKEAAEAAQAVNEQVLKARKAQQEAKAEERKRPQKELIEQIKAIKEYRSEYGAATDLSPAPGEPSLPDGASLPGKK